MPLDGDRLEEEEYVERRRPQPASMAIVIALTGLALAFLAQFGGAVWVWSAMATNVTNIKESIKDMRDERYTKNDAARDIQRLDQQDRIIDGRMQRLEERVERLGRP